MANYNLTNQTISSSFQQLLQKDTDTGNLVDGLGNPIDGLDVDGIISSSFIGDGSGLTNIPHTEIPQGTVSGSSQIDYPLISNIPSGIVSSSEQLPSGLVSGSSQVNLTDTTFVDGTEFMVLRTDGAGNLSFDYADRAQIEIRTDEAIVKGDPLYVTGFSNGENRVTVGKADASDPSKMPAYGLAYESVSQNTNTQMVAIGSLDDVNTQVAPNDFQVGETLYVAAGGGLTNVKPTGTNLIQNVGIVGRRNQNNGEILVSAIGRSNDIPNIPQGQAWVGNSNGVAQAVSTASWDEKTDITQLNSFTQSQEIFNTNITTRVDGLSNETSSYARTDISNTFTGTQIFDTITANSASIGYLQTVTGSATIIGDSIIILNNDTPTQRYAGVAVYDSGSAGVTASFEFDGLSNDWFYEYSDDGGVTTDHGVTLFGPEYNTKGSPIYPTNNRIQKGDGGHHLLDSNITDDGTTITVTGPNIAPAAILDVKGGAGTSRLTVQNDVLAGFTGQNILLNGKTLVTDDLTLNNNNAINLDLGSSINFVERFDGGIGTSALRFHSGSNVDGNKWVNIQPEPGGQGRLAIASFPENNHFVFFDPKDSGIGNQRVYFESVIEGGRNGGTLAVGNGLEVTGSVNVSGNETIIGDETIEGTNVIPGSTLTVKDGNGTSRLQVNNATLKGLTGVDVLVNGNLLNGGNQTINGVSTQNNTAPGSNQENAFVNVSGAVVQGRNYNRAFFGMADYPSYGKQFEDYFSIEYYDSFGYNYGSEFAINGSGATIQTVPETTGFNGRATISTVDNYDGTADININARNGNTNISGNLNINGTTIISSNVVTAVSSTTVSGGTATIDFATTSLNQITLDAGTVTNIDAVNMAPGMTINVLITQNATPGTVTFDAKFKQPDGSAYVASTTAGAKDILTLMTFGNPNEIYVVAVNKFV